METNAKKKLEESIDNIFYNVQFNKTSHQKFMKKLRKLYDIVDFETFWECFISCLKVPLCVGQKHPHVENSLEFAAKFVLSFSSFSQNDSIETMGPFLSKMFEFLLAHHSARDLAVRFRICHFLNILLDSMGEHAFIDDKLCDQITASMTERLLDKSHKVRAQAVFALHRLQDPSDRDCPVIKLYMFHLSKDPSPEVRKAVLACMGKNAETLHVALKRTRDVNEQVRKMAYEFINKITVKSLKIEQRIQLLSDGLRDRSDVVKRCVQTLVLPSWLQYYSYDYVKLLKAFDVEMSIDISILALSTLFQNAQLNILLEQVPVYQGTKLIPMNSLTSENVLYWRCLIKFLQKEHCLDELDTILPELTSFCAYIRDFCTLIETGQSDIWEQQTKQFILLQLFEIATMYDLADEVGRKHLYGLILQTLKREYCSEKVIECVVKHLEAVMPDVTRRINELANVIKDIRLPPVQCDEADVPTNQEHERNMKKAKLKVMLLELNEAEYDAARKKDYAKAKRLNEEVDSLNQEILKLSEEPIPKNDRETMTKCLTIMCNMMQARSITTLTPTLHELLEIALEGLDHSDDAVHIRALKAVSIYCTLDRELAKKHIMMLFLQLTLEQENRAVWVMALKGIFDLLLLYGLEYFDIMQDIGADITGQSHSRRTIRSCDETTGENSIASLNRSAVQDGTKNFITILTGLLENANQEVRTVATEGFCKLILHRRINGASLLSRLIMLCFNPATKGDIYLRQCLSSFFENYTSRVPDGQKTLETAYLPTLKIVCNAPEDSPLQDVDPYDVAKFILNLTAVANTKDDASSYCAHNSLALAILANILNPKSKIEKEPLVKSLKDLEIHTDDNAWRGNLLNMASKAMDLIMKYDKSLVKYIEQFKKKVTTSDTDQAPEKTTENETTDNDEDNDT